MTTPQNVTKEHKISNEITGLGSYVARGTCNKLSSLFVSWQFDMLSAAWVLKCGMPGRQWMVNRENRGLF